MVDSRNVVLGFIVALSTLSLSACGSTPDPVAVAHQEATAACETRAADQNHIGSDARYDSITVTPGMGETTPDPSASPWPEPQNLAPNPSDTSAEADAKRVLSEGTYTVTGNVNGIAFTCSVTGDAGDPSSWK